MVLSQPAPILPVFDENDTDLDGIEDTCDNCPNAYNPHQIDTDNDGLGDVCDTTAVGDYVTWSRTYGSAGLNEQMSGGDNCLPMPGGGYLLSTYVP